MMSLRDKITFLKGSNAWKTEQDNFCIHHIASHSEALSVSVIWMLLSTSFFVLLLFSTCSHFNSHSLLSALPAYIQEIRVFQPFCFTFKLKTLNTFLLWVKRKNGHLTWFFLQQLLFHSNTSQVLPSPYENSPPVTRLRAHVTFMNFRILWPEL